MTHEQEMKIENSALVELARQAAFDELDMHRTTLRALAEGALDHEESKVTRRCVEDLHDEMMLSDTVHATIRDLSSVQSSVATAVSRIVERLNDAGVEAEFKLNALESALADADALLTSHKSQLAAWDEVRDWLIENNGGGSMGSPQELVMFLLKQGVANAKRVVALQALNASNFPN